jgi:hypothetical protein
MTAAPAEVMTATADIAPYANPAHWGGMILGHSPTTKATAVRAPKTLEKRAVGQLENFLPGYPGLEVSQTYEPNSTFPYGWYPLGTIAIFNREMLRAEEPDYPYADMAEFDGAPAPDPDDSLIVQLDDDQQLHHRPKQVFDRGLVYQDANFYGVVTADRKHNKQLVVIGASRITEFGFGTADEADAGRLHKVEVEPPSYNQVESDQLVVGSVQHHRGGRKRSPRLVRINRLHVLSLGQAA